MERFVKGDVVVLPFPFSDYSTAKSRPALVVCDLTGDDLILCLITSQHKTDGYSIDLTDSDFLSGSLKHASEIRANRLFTTESSIIRYRAGKINREKITEVIEKIVDIIRN